MSGNAGKHAKLLLAAVDAGNIDEVRRLLDDGGDVNALYWSGYSIPERAAAFGHLEILKLLVDRGADLTFVDREHKTALAWAHSQGQPATLGYLKTVVESTPTIVTCARLGLLTDVIRLLDEDEVDVESAGADGITPLVAAARNHRWEVVKALLARGANPTEFFKMFATIGRIVADMPGSGRPEVVAQLMRNGADPNAKDVNGDPAIVSVARAGNVDVLDALLASPDIRPFERGASGVMALEAALIAGHFLIAKKLYAHNPTASHEFTKICERLLELALFENDLEFATDMIARGAALSDDAADPDLLRKALAAIVAFPRKDLDAAKLVCRDPQGAVLLAQQCVGTMNWAGAGLLASGGAIPALFKGATEVLTHVFVAAASCRHVAVEALQHLVTLGAAPQGTDTSGKAALQVAFHMALTHARDDVASYLLDLQVVDVNAAAADGSRPLHVAVTRCAGALVERLLREGADRSARNGEGRTAWRLALLSDLDDAAIEALRSCEPSCEVKH